MELILSESRKESIIHIDKIPISLNSCQPTPLKPEELTKQLNALGLSCDETYGQKLQKNIEDVTSKIGIGKLTTFGIYKDGGNLEIEQLPNDILSDICSENSLNALLKRRYEKTADGSWTEGTTGQYTPKLLALQQINNYNYLKIHTDDLPYAEKSADTITKNLSTVDAIKEMFVEAATTCTAATVSGIDKETLDATFSNALAQLNESVFASDYDVSNNRVITLLDNYDPKSGNCDGVGVVTCNWRLEIKNYKEKKKEPRHQTTLTIGARSLLYRDTASLDKHYAMLLTKNKGALCLLSKSIPIISQIKVYDTLPPANMDTFINSLPCKTDTEYADVMVFYSSDLQKEGYIDNTQSCAETTYTKSLTSGFMTQTTVGISAEINFEINAIAAKFGAKVGFNVSMTDQWNKSQTETISFRVPAGKRAFLYQVTMLCARLRLNSKTGKYSYIEYGKFLTDTYKTSENPLYEG